MQAVCYCLVSVRAGARSPIKRGLLIIASRWCCFCQPPWLFEAGIGLQVLAIVLPATRTKNQQQVLAWGRQDTSRLF